MEKFSLACTHILQASEKIEAHVLLHRPVQPEDSGKMFFCFFCKEDLEKIIAEHKTKMFSLAHESDVRQKLLNY